MQRIHQKFSLGMMTSVLFGLLAATGCSDDAGSKPTSPAATDSNATAAAAAAPATAEPIVDERSPEARIQAGRSVYMANCIACHGMDPTRDGALGPAVSGASLELIEARVLRGEYPEGYVPKRPSRVMIPLPHLERQLPELAAYLGSFE